MKRLLMHAAAIAGLVVSACGSTGGNVVTFDVAARGTAGASTIDSALGWHIVLTRAKLHLGAVYLNLSRPISVSQETNCIQPGVYTAEQLSPLDVDVLSTSLQPFPARGDGTDDTAVTGEVWLTGGDINADSDSTTIADLAGTATRAAQVVSFTATITISSKNRGITVTDPSLPSLHPICKQRIVSPIQIDLRPHDGGTLVIAVDTRLWFDNVDFATVPPDGVIPDTNDNDPSKFLFSGLRAATATFQFSFP